MTKVFLDTNIILDFYLNRSGAEAAESVFRYANTGAISLYASTLTFANFAYVAKHGHTKDEVYVALDEFERCITALAMDQRQLRKAIDSRSKDFEDMLQYQCAVAGGCDVILTNNKTDFVEISRLPLLTAAEFLAQL